MNKNIAHLIMSDKQIEYLRNKANESATSMTFQVKNMLHEWYSQNKAALDENNINNLMNLDITFDEETEKIYKLFVANIMNNLIK